VQRFITRWLNPSVRFTGLHPFDQLLDAIAEIECDGYDVADWVRDIDYDGVFLRTVYWKTVSQEVKQRAGRVCENCGRTERLQAHHITYDHLGSEHRHLDDLLCLCSVCHKLMHNQVIQAVLEQWARGRERNSFADDLDLTRCGFSVESRVRACRSRHAGDPDPDDEQDQRR
jgi:hypothetical protein